MTNSIWTLKSIIILILLIISLDETIRVNTPDTGCMGRANQHRAVTADC